MATKLGFPSISNPREGDWRAVGVAVSNIRQRVEQLEGMLTTVQATAQHTAFSQGSLFSTQLNALQAQMNELEAELAALAGAAAASGETFTAQAFEPLQPNVPVVWAGNGFVREADPTDPDRAFGLAGILVSPAAGAGQQVTIRRAGVASLTGYSFTPFAPVFVNTGTGPTLTQNPSDYAYAMQVGVAISPTHLAVLPQASWINSYDEIALGDDNSPTTKHYVDNRSVNPFVVKTASETMSGHRIVIADSAAGVSYADNGTLAHSHLVLGLTLGAVAAGAPVTVQVEGEIVEPSWSWTPELPLFLGEDGLMTQTAPSSPAAFSLVVGFAVSETKIVLNFKEPVALG